MKAVTPKKRVRLEAVSATGWGVVEGANGIHLVWLPAMMHRHQAMK